MPDNPKVMARVLREQLHTRGLDLSHGECLDLVARQLGHRDWNVLAARTTVSTLVHVRRSCEWIARKDDAELGRISAVKRPDERWFVACDSWSDDAHAALVDAVAGDLRQPLYATIDESDAESLARYTASGFAVHRREDEFTVDVSTALATLPDIQLAGYTFASATDVDEAGLRALDEALREDVPGCDGWVNEPHEFRVYTFAPWHFDPRLYLVALEGGGAMAGLVRIWTAPKPHRLGLIGVLSAHRGRGLASALLAAAFRAVSAQGVTYVVAEADSDNRASQALLRGLGARRTGGSVELFRPAAGSHADEPATNRRGPA